MSPTHHIIPAGALQNEVRALMKETLSPHGLILRWVPQYSAFVAAIPATLGTWEKGGLVCSMPAHEATAISLYIDEKTKPIIDALQATLTRNPVSEIEWFDPKVIMPDDEVGVLFAVFDGEVYMGSHQQGEWVTENYAPIEDRRVALWAHVPDVSVFTKGGQR